MSLDILRLKKGKLINSIENKIWSSSPRQALCSPQAASPSQGGTQAAQAISPRLVRLLPRQSNAPNQGIVQAVQALFPRQTALPPSHE